MTSAMSRRAPANVTRSPSPSSRTSAVSRRGSGARPALPRPRRREASIGNLAGDEGGRAHERLEVLAGMDSSDGADQRRRAGRPGRAHLRDAAARSRSERGRRGCKAPPPCGTATPREHGRRRLRDAEDVVGGGRPDRDQRVEYPLGLVQGVAAIVKDVWQAEGPRCEAAFQQHLHVGVDDVGADSAG